MARNKDFFVNSTPKRDRSFFVKEEKTTSNVVKANTYPIKDKYNSAFAMPVKQGIGDKVANFFKMTLPTAAEKAVDNIKEPFTGASASKLMTEAKLSPQMMVEDAKIQMAKENPTREDYAMVKQTQEVINKYGKPESNFRAISEDTTKLQEQLKSAEKTWQVSPVDATLANTGAGVANIFGSLGSFANSLGADKVPLLKDVTNFAVDGARKAQENAQQYNRGNYGEALGTVTQGVVNLVPYFVLGTGKTAVKGATAVTKYAKYIEPIIKNPSFWYSLTSMWGSKYQEKLDEGYNRFQALGNSILYAVPAALIEVSGGIGAKGKETQSLLRTMGEEIGEEIAQDIMGGISDKIATNHDLPVFSTTEDAIINPKQLAKTAAYTAPIVAIGGGANNVINKTINNRVENQKAQAQINQDLQEIRNKITPATDLSIQRENVTGLPKLNVQNATQNVPSQQTNTTLPTQVEMTQKANTEQINANPNLATQKAQKTYQSAKIAGMTDMDIKKATDLNNMLRSGANLEFYDEKNIPQNVQADKAKIANGFYQDGTLWINKNSKNKVEQILGHELTHHLETTNSYTDLSNTILDSDVFYDYISEKGYTNVAEYKTKLKEMGYTDAQMNNEMVARFVEEKLFTDQNSIDRLARQNTKLVEKIKNWISDLVVSFKGTSQEKELRRIENMYRKALEQARNTTASSETQYSIGGTKGWNNLAKTGKYAEGSAGWFRDKNGDLKFEFSDKLFKLKDGIKLYSNKSYKLGDILEHEVLFDAYPQLRKYNVEFEKMKNTNGKNINLTKTILLNPETLNTNEAIEKTLLHEIQHAIQKIEGFEGGRNSRRSKLAYYESLGEIEAADTVERFEREKVDRNYREKVMPRSAEANPQHPKLQSYLQNRKEADIIKDEKYLQDKERKQKIKDAIDEFFGWEEVNEGDNGTDLQLLAQKDKQNSRLLDRGGLNNEESDNSNIYKTTSEDNKLSSRTDGRGRLAGKEPAFSMPEKAYVTDAQKRYVNKIGSIQYNLNDDGTYYLYIENKNGDLEYTGNRAKEKVLDMLGIEVGNKIVNNATSETKIIRDIPTYPYVMTQEEVDRAVSKAKKSFKTTKDFREVGYLTVDGAMLDFSDKRNGGPAGTRNNDHREIDVIGYNMNEFINMGNIRMKPESHGFELSTMPTEAQEKALKKYIDYFDGDMYIDIAERGNVGKTVDYLKYNRGTSSDKILSDIKYYFETGKKPYVSELNDFRYSVNPTKGGKKPTSTKALSKYAQTLQNKHEDIPEQVNLIQKEVDNGNFTHEVIHDKRSLNYAQKYIEDNGFDDAVKHWDELIKRGKPVDKDELALGQMIYNVAVDNKDTRLVMKMASDLVQEYTEIGRNLQSATLLRKMTPDGRLYALERSVQKINQDLMQKFDNFENIQIPEELADKLLRSETQKDMDTAVEQIQEYIASKIPATWQEKLNSWRYLAMLGNPRTHIRNIVGNAVFIPAVEMKNVLAQVGELAISKDQRTKAFVTSLSKQDAKLLKYAENDFDKNQETIRGENKYDIKSGVQEKRTIYSNGAIEAARKGNFKLLEAEDTLFLKFRYKKAFAGALKARGITIEQLRENSPETVRKVNEIRSYAINEAQKATYRDASKVAQWFNDNKRTLLNKASQSTGAGKLGWNIVYLGMEGVIPFTKTPINIVKRGIEYSPAGLLNGIKNAVFDVKSGKVTAAQAIDKIAAGATGTAVAGLGFFLASIGLVSGGEEEKDKEQGLKQLKGNQDYALNIGNKSYTIDWSAPSSIPLFIGVELYNTITSEDESAYLNALSKMVEPVVEMSMLQGLNDTLTTLGEDSAIGNIAGKSIMNYLGQYNPTLLGQIARSFDPVRRATYVDKNIPVPAAAQRFIQQQAAKIPGVSRMLPTYKDQFGQEQITDGVINRIVQNFFSPGYLKDIKEGTVEQGLTELYEKTGETSVIPGYASKSLTHNGEKINLTAKQYDTYAKTRGELSKKGLEGLFKDSYYKSLTDKQKVKVVEAIYDYAGEIAKTKVIDDYELEFNDKKIQKLQNEGLDFYKYILFKKTADADGNDYISNDELDKAIKKYGLSRWQKTIKEKNTKNTKATNTLPTLKQQRAKLPTLKK